MLDIDSRQGDPAAMGDNPDSGQFDQRVDRALDSIRVRLPNVTETSGDGNAFTVVYSVPNGAENESLPQLENRFRDEMLTFSDSFEAHGLPPLSDIGTWEKSCGSDGDSFHCTYQRTRELTPQDTDFGFDPAPGELDRMVQNRRAADDTPPLPIGTGAHAPLTTDDVMSFGASSPVGDGQTADLMMDASQDRGDRMGSLRDAVEQYKERAADEREMNEASRGGMQRGMVAEGGNAAPYLPRALVRRGRGGQDMRPRR